MPSDKAKIDAYHQRLDLTWRADGKTGAGGLEPFHSYHEAYEAFAEANGLPSSDVPIPVIAEQLRLVAARSVLRLSNAPQIDHAPFSATLFESMRRYAKVRYDEMEEVEWRSITSSGAVHNFPDVEYKIIHASISTSLPVAKDDLLQNDIHAIWGIPNVIARKYKESQYKAVLNEVTNPMHYNRAAGNLSAGSLSLESLRAALRLMQRQASDRSLSKRIVPQFLFVPRHMEPEAWNLCNRVAPISPYKLQCKVLDQDDSNDWFVMANPHSILDTVACTTHPGDRPELTVDALEGGLLFRADGVIQIKMLDPRMFHKVVSP